jgi:hypothetical protein
MSNALDKTINNSGKNSNNVTLQKYQTTYFQTSKLLELIDRRRKIINLKVAAESALAKLSRADRRLLVLSYVDGMKCETLAEMFGISLRTFFRRKSSALDHFAVMLETLGYDAEFYSNEYASEKWFLAVYDDCLTKGGESENLDRYVIKRLFNEIANVPKFYKSYV